MIGASHLRSRTLLLVCLVCLVGMAINLSLAEDETPPPKPTAAQCMNCHDGTLEDFDEDMMADMVEAVPADWKPKGSKADKKRAGVSTTVDLAKMKKTGHGDDCLACHIDIEKLNHAARLQPVDCGNCHDHDDFVEPYQQSAHYQAAQAGKANAPVCADCHGAHDIMSASDAASPMNRANVAQLCGQCHTTSVIAGRTGVGAYDRWLQSVHARRNEQGVNATCNDCHDSHDARYAAGKTAKPNISGTCGRCHKKVKEEYEMGVHGQSLADGNLSSPTCTDCHGSHGIRSTEDAESTVYGFCAVEGCCSQCHEAERINTRFGIKNTTQSYADSYHGLALKKGDSRAADCASCHGSHAVLVSSDPRSSIHPDNLQTTCGKCHPGIGAGVAKGKVHPELARDAETIGERVQWWVRLVYLLLIPATLGFMFLHNLLDWLKKLRLHFARKKLLGEYERLDLTERIQHIVLMISFSLLVISGFALTFGWKVPGISGETNEIMRAYTHRIAALIMIGWFIFHAFWLVATKRGRGYILDMIPRLKDGFDIVYALMYYVGLRADKPKFDRFGYIEKMEYLAMMWGTVVMVGTGLVLWFEEPMLKLMPLWGFDVAHIVHLMEAILATLAIIIWHFYSVLFNPDVQPMATHWLQGTLTEEEMEHEHPLELERIKKREVLNKQEEE